MATPGELWKKAVETKEAKWAAEVQRAIQEHAWKKGIDAVSPAEFNAAWMAGLVRAGPQAWFRGLCTSPKVPDDVKRALGCPT